MIMVFGWLIIMVVFCTWMFKLWGRKLHAQFTKGTPVLLRDYDGKVYRTIGYVNEFGVHYAHTFWQNKIGYNTLLEEGKVEQPNYIKEWKQG